MLCWTLPAGMIMHTQDAWPGGLTAQGLKLSLHALRCQCWTDATLSMHWGGCQGILSCRQEEEESSCQSQGTLDREDPRMHSLPANLLRSACSASALDLDAQLLRLRKLFDAQCLYDAIAEGSGPKPGKVVPIMTGPSCVSASMAGQRSSFRSVDMCWAATFGYQYPCHLTGAV